MDQTAEHVIRNSDDMVEAFRSRKEQLGLFNETVDAQLLIGAGACDKYLGPSQVKRLSAHLIGDLMTCSASSS
jgi:hypothetical protein